MSLKYYPIWIAASILGAGAIVAWAPQRYEVPGLITLLLVSLTVANAYVMAAYDQLDPLGWDETQVGDDLVDPWAIQETLMEASGQHIARVPSINNTSVLYAALKLEEGAETLAGLERALNRLATDQDCPQDLLSDQIAAARHVMDQQSRAIRKTLATAPQFDEPLTPDEAVEIFDGTTDETVVNCGFASASGFDGTAGYMEVGSSNLSKRNPETGVIDKTPDGKWIKGADYCPPDLRKVLARTAHDRAMLAALMRV